MNEQNLKGKPEELIRAEQLIDDAKVHEAHELLNNFERRKGLTLHDKVLCHLLKCDLLYQQGRYKELLMLAEQTYKESSDSGNILHSVDCLIFMANSFLEFRKLDKSLDVITQGEELLKSVSQELSSDIMKREANILFIKGRVSAYKSEGNLCLKYFKQSLELVEKTDFKRLNAIILRTFGWFILQFKGDIEQAFEYVKKGVAIAKESKNKFTIAQCLLNLGILYNSTGDWERGLKIEKECLSTYEELDNKERISTVLGNISEIYKKFTDDIDRASEFMEKSLTICETENYWWGAGRLSVAIDIALKKGDHKRAKKYFQRLEQINNQVKDKESEVWYRIGKALILKASSRFRDKAKAEKILRQIIDEEVFHIEYTLLALINLCDILLAEFRVTNNIEVLEEVNYFITILLDKAEKSHSYLVLCETYLFQAKLALLSFDLKKSRRFLTKAQKIAESYGIKRLAMKISHEHDELLKQLNLWEKLKDSEAPLPERWKIAGLNEQMEIMVKKRMIEIPKLSEEEPVSIFIITEGGSPLFSHSFIGEKSFESHLFGGFLTTIDYFIREMFSEGLDRAIFGEYTLLMNSIPPFFISYLFKGDSYHALKKLNYFMEHIQKEDVIWQKLLKSFQVNQTIKIKDIPLLESLIMEIFITKSIIFSEL